jgi:hypothetical protein
MHISRQTANSITCLLSDAATCLGNRCTTKKLIELSYDANTKRLIRKAIYQACFVAKPRMHTKLEKQGYSLTQPSCG